MDTHVLIWAVTNSPLLPSRVKMLIANNEAFVCAASAWEISTKYRSGKLLEVAPVIENFAVKVRSYGYTFLSVTVEHALLAGSFTMDNKDPFDRVIAAQAHLEKMPLLSADAAFDTFPIERLW